MGLLLFGAGFETTTNLIGNGVLALLRHPEQMSLLRDDPGRMANAIEELLRYDASIQISGRSAFEDLELDGHAIAAGTFPLLAADLRIGVDGHFKLGLNEVKIGLTVPLYVVELARQRLTPRDYNRALVTGAFYAPDEAVGAGLLDRVVAAEELREVSLGAAEELTGLNMEAHAATKQRVREGALKALRGAVEAELAALGDGDS